MEHIIQQPKISNQQAPNGYTVTLNDNGNKLMQFKHKILMDGQIQETEE